MKRSEYIAIGAVGLLTVAAFWPRNVTSVGGTNNDVPPDAQAFASVEECRMAAGMTSEACDRAFASVQQASVANAPRFNDQASCEAQYGASQCRSSSWNGASVFVPALVGALVARSLANAGQPHSQFRSQPLYPPRAGPANCPQGASTPGQPECAPQSRSSGTSGTGAAFGSGRTYSTGSGTTVTRPPGSDARVRVDARPRTEVNAPRSNINAPRSTASPSGSNTVSRSGFGSTGQSMSGGG